MGNGQKCCKSKENRQLGQNLTADKAEREGFEPSLPYSGKSVFETDAFNHSATSPGGDILPPGRAREKEGSRVARD